MVLLGNDELVDVLLPLDLLLFELLRDLLVDGAHPRLGLLVEDAELRVEVQVFHLGHVHCSGETKDECQSIPGVHAPDYLLRWRPPRCRPPIPQRLPRFAFNETRFKKLIARRVKRDTHA